MTYQSVLGRTIMFPDKLASKTEQIVTSSDHLSCPTIKSNFAHRQNGKIEVHSQ